MSIEEQMRELAVKFNVEPSEFLPRIAKAREMMKIDIEICPCDAKDEARGCISEKCLKEIMETGTCHCRAFRRKDNVES